MGRHLAVIDYDAVFRKLHNPLILNDLVNETEEDQVTIASRLMTRYENTDMLGCIPTCLCGYLHEGFYLDEMCPLCNTRVEKPAEGVIALDTWMRVPDGVTGFISPLAWLMLNKIIGSKNYNLVEWLTNRNSHPPAVISKDTAHRISVLTEMGWERGLNSFIASFDEFINLLPNLRVKQCDVHQKFFRDNRDRLFPQVIPLPSKSLLVLERTFLGTFADLSGSFALDAAKSIINIGNADPDTYTLPQLESKVTSILSSISKYCTSVIKSSLSGKSGWARGQVASSRANFSMRAVITAITEPHHYEEIHIPWAQGLELFRYHLIAKLYKLDYSQRAAYELIETSANIYSPLLANLLQELIDEARKLQIDGENVIGIPCTIMRNPTLERGSIQCGFITVVKGCLLDLTVSLSPLVITASNADFDGDENMILLPPDNHTRRMIMRLRPHYYAYSLIDIGSISRYLKLPDVTVTTIGNWLTSGE